ncbi:hypothetical protein TNCV_432841 [Trichonephila clavipes]|nr:hypothetical protein TNCV_432841 [Trichonephila clavipes]
MSEPDLSASTLRKQCVFQWQEDLRCRRLMLVSCHLCDVITWWEQKLSALKIVVLSDLKPWLFQVHGSSLHHEMNPCESQIFGCTLVPREETLQNSNSTRLLPQGR